MEILNIRDKLTVGIGRYLQLLPNFTRYSTSLRFSWLCFDVDLYGLSKRPLKYTMRKGYKYKNSMLAIVPNQIYASAYVSYNPNSPRIFNIHLSVWDNLLTYRSLISLTFYVGPCLLSLSVDNGNPSLTLTAKGVSRIKQIKTSK